MEAPSIISFQNMFDIGTKLRKKIENFSINNKYVFCLTRNDINDMVYYFIFLDDLVAMQCTILHWDASSLEIGH
jgi:hypothetical protein